MASDTQQLAENSSVSKPERRNRRASLVMSDDPNLQLLKASIEDHGRSRGKNLMTLSNVTEDDRADIEDCWKALDGDKLGSIGVKQLMKAAEVVLGPEHSSERDMKKALSMVDASHNGQVDWLAFRAYMYANWNAARDADHAMWQEHRHVTDMLLVDGSMRLVDMLKAYKRRTWVERSLKDATIQLRQLQHRREAGEQVDTEPTTSLKHCGSVPFLSPAPPKLSDQPRGPRRKPTASLQYDEEIEMMPVFSQSGESRSSYGHLRVTVSGATTTNSLSPHGTSVTPGRLRRASLVIDAALGVEASGKSGSLNLFSMRDELTDLMALSQPIENTVQPNINFELDNGGIPLQGPVIKAGDRQRITMDAANDQTNFTNRNRKAAVGDVSIKSVLSVPLSRNLGYSKHSHSAHDSLDEFLTSPNRGIIDSIFKGGGKSNNSLAQTGHPRNHYTRSTPGNR